MIGSAPQASLLAISIGFGGEGDDSDQQIAEAVRWAVDNGADVINMSLTRNTLDWPESWDDAFLYAMEHDVVIVAAAGNRGSGTVEVGAPATMPGVLTVSGVDRNGNASFDASSQGITIGVAAPSEELVGVYPRRRLRHLERHERRDPDRRRHRRAGARRAPGARRRERHQPHRRRRRATSATRAPTTPTATGWWMPRPRSSADVAQVDENPVGDLQEWIRLNRRAEATPTPGAIDAAGHGSGGRGGPREPDRDPAAVGHHAAAGRHPGPGRRCCCSRCWSALVVAAVRQFGSGRRAR